MAGQLHQLATVAGGAQVGAFDEGTIAPHEIESVKPLGPAGFDGIYKVKVLLAIHDTKQCRTGKCQCNKEIELVQDSRAALHVWRRD